MSEAKFTDLLEKDTPEKSKRERKIIQELADKQRKILGFLFRKKNKEIYTRPAEIHEVYCGDCHNRFMHRFSEDEVNNRIPISVSCPHCLAKQTRESEAVVFGRNK